MREVQAKIEELLKRGSANNAEGEKLRAMHLEVAEDITEEELEAYLAQAKKGTAPGISGVPIEMWWYAPKTAKAKLCKILNMVLNGDAVPELWKHRVIRPLAKTETAVGLSDIRPITLLEVSQKILTGILTQRLGAVWNLEGMLASTQMAFLQGRGCYQSIERLRGVMMDSKHTKRACHMLFLDLAKAYDSVEYWAMEDAMIGMGVPPKVVDVMRKLDVNAQAQVLMGKGTRTKWIPLGRGAPQGEVMPPLRFIVWMNLLHAGNHQQLEGGL